MLRFFLNWLNGFFCGKDSMGNMYFYHKSTVVKRWVSYNNNDDLYIDPAWHCWLYNIFDTFPDKEATKLSSTLNKNRYSSNTLNIFKNKNKRNMHNSIWKP